MRQAAACGMSLVSFTAAMSPLKQYWPRLSPSVTPVSSAMRTTLAPSVKLPPPMVTITSALAFFASGQKNYKLLDSMSIYDSIFKICKLLPRRSSQSCSHVLTKQITSKRIRKNCAVRRAPKGLPPETKCCTVGVLIPVSSFLHIPFISFYLTRTDGFRMPHRRITPPHVSEFEAATIFCKLKYCRL